MAIESEAAEPGTKTDETPRSPYAVLVELEGVAVAARRAEFDALRSVLGELKLTITPQHFVRYCLNVPPAAYLPALLAALGGKKNGTPAMAEEIKNGIALFLSSDEAAPNPALSGLLEQAHQRHMDLALLSFSKESVVHNLIAKWPGHQERSKVITFDPAGKSYPRADIWLKAAKTLGRTPRQCVVLAGSQVSMRTALSAGMRCIVVPDEFTSFQDFSGADIVVDGDQELDAAAMLNTVAPLKPFI